MRLFLCEKPSQAGDIARVLGAARRVDGAIEGKDFVVTLGLWSLAGAGATGGVW